MIIVRMSMLVFFVILTSSVWAGEMVLTPESYNRSHPVSIKVSDRGEIWVAYYDLKGEIHIRNASGDKDFTVNEGKGGISRGLDFDVQGDHVFVAWREKITGKKRLWFRASHDGGKTLSEPIPLDEKSEPLTRIKIGSNSRGDVFVLWYGEKKVGDSDYNIYCASSRDFGRTFSEVQNITLGYRHAIYPSLLVDNEGAYTFSYAEKQGRKYIVFRKTSDGGKTWSSPLEIKEIGVVTLFVYPIKVDKRLHVFWFNTYDGVPVVESAYSDDDGKTWRSTVFEETRDLDIGLLKVAHDGKGHIYLSFHGIKDEKEKYKVFIISSGDNGTTWGRLTPLRHYPFEHTHAQNPDIIAKDNGEVVVVWVDYRNIRSNLYMQYSKDYGKTWQERDIPLEEPGRFNTSLYPYTDSLVKIGDGYYVLAYRFKDDLTLEKADLLLLNFNLESRGVR